MNGAQISQLSAVSDSMLILKDMIFHDSKCDVLYSKKGTTLLVAVVRPRLRENVFLNSRNCFLRHIRPLRPWTVIKTHKHLKTHHVEFRWLLGHFPVFQGSQFGFWRRQAVFPVLFVRNGATNNEYFLFGYLQSSCLRNW